MTENEYYNAMSSFADLPADKVKDVWFECFSYILEKFKVGFTKEAIKSLFHKFTMNNWKALHRENSPDYADSSNEDIRRAFAGEAHYISDRVSYDRLFRVHWLYLRGYVDGDGK